MRCAVQTTWLANPLKSRPRELSMAGGNVAARHHFLLAPHAEVRGSDAAKLCISLINNKGRPPAAASASLHAESLPSTARPTFPRPTRASHLCSFPVCGSLVPQSADAAAHIRCDLIWLIKSLWAPICALKGRCCTVLRPRLLLSAML